MRVCDIENCGKKYFARGKCQKHYHRMRRHDKSYVAKEIKQKKITFIEDEQNCFIVNSHSIGNSGYPSVYYRRESVAIHRKIYTEMFGEIPKGMVVRHTCDKRNCINPEHLIIGTHQENSQDMIDRNRSTKGERNGLAKLTKKDVLEIRECKGLVSNKDLVEKYKVSESTIIRAKNNITWRHL